LDEISITPYKAKHFELVLEMHKLQKSPSFSHLTHATMPKVGYIAMMGKQPIAAGFLRRLEPCYGQIDTLESNPLFGSKIRHEAIKKVVDELVSDAYRLKLQGIISFTGDTGTLSRAIGLGFVVLEGQTLIALPLSPA